MTETVLDLVPLVLAGYLTWVAAAHGAHRLWRDAVMLTLAALAFALIVPDLQVTEGGDKGLGGSGFRTIYFPIGVLAPAVVAWLCVRRPIPAWVGRPLSVIIGALASYVATLNGFWIS